MKAISIKEGSKAVIYGEVKSNYYITKVEGSILGANNQVVQKVQMDTGNFGTKKKSVKIPGSKVDKNLKCGKLSAGTYTLKIEAWDKKNSGVKSATATITVNGDVKKPTIGNIRNVAGGKKITISKSQSNAKLWYKLGSQNAQSTTANSIEPKITSTMNVDAWCELNGKKSGHETKTITIPRLEPPYIEACQKGRKVQLVLKSDASRISYRIGEGAWRDNYVKGTVIELSDGQKLECYAEADGYARSNVEDFIAELTVPGAPKLQLMGEDAVAVGKTVTVSWQKDWKAESYKATLYQDNGDGEGTEVKTVETDKPTASFALEEEGKYHVTAIAINDLGESDVSNAVNVEAKGPLTVVFRDAAVEKKQTAPSGNGEDPEAGENEGDGEDPADPDPDGDDPQEEYGPVIATVTVPYGEKLDPIGAPSKRGHTFIGWNNTNTGEVSENAYAKSAVKEDTTYVAVYEKKKYKVRLYDPNGCFMMTREVPFGESAIPDDIEETLEQIAEKDGGFTLTGHKINWMVIKVADDDSEADVNAVDSNMHIQAVCQWERETLPVVLEIQEEVHTIYEDGVVLRPKVKITTNENKKQEIYLIATVKGVDGETGVEKALYMDRRVFSVPTGTGGLVLNGSDGAHDFDLPIEEKYANATTKLELVAVEKKQNGTTGSTYSEVESSEIIRDFGYTAASEWSLTKEEAQEGREFESKKQWIYRDKRYIESGYESVAGYTKESERVISDPAWSRWMDGSSSDNGKVTRYNNYKDIKYVQNVNAYKYSAKLCKCGRVSTEKGGTLCSSCKTKTDVERKLKIFTQNKPSTKYTVTKGTTIKVNSSCGSLGSIYQISYGHTNIVLKNDYTNSVAGTNFWIDNDGKTRPFYRERTKRIANVFYQYTPWSNEAYADPDSEKAWSDTEIKATSTKQVQQRTLWRYRDRIDTPELMDQFEEQVKHIEGHLDVEEDLNGMVGTVMVYQANNTDPNQYQMQYTGQITFADGPEGEKNYYSFDFIPKDDPSISSGNYVVSIGVEGLTGLVTVDTYEAPRETHEVTLSYQKDGPGEDDAEQVVIAEQDVIDGGDVDMSEVTIPEREGYIFAGWNRSLTNITENCEIQANYLPEQNAVAFVDWVNQTIDLRVLKTGDPIVPPAIKDDGDEEAYYKFKGWKKEDGSYLADGDVVSGNMVITAEFEPATFTVKFIGIDGEEVDTQTVEYRNSAEPPEYAVPEGSGSFIGWSTDVNWWDVEGDVTVRPLVIHAEQALEPVDDIYTDEDTGKRCCALETEEEGAEIYYAEDETLPTAGMIQEYLQTDPDEYVGNIKKYVGPITFPEGEDTVGPDEMEINAVSYVSGKDLSNVHCVLFEKEADPDGDYDYEEDAGWNGIGEYEVKARAGNDVRINVELEENPGLTGYDFLIKGDKNTFRPDCDEYGDPNVEAGALSESGTFMTSDLESGWRVNWNSNEPCTDNGRLFTLTLHVEDEAEEGIYPIAVSYAPEFTLDEEYLTTELENVKVTVDSEASTPLDTLDVALARYSYVYEGEAIEPVVRIEGLREGDDFTVEYENNVNVGTAKAVITGIGDYTGTVEKEFTITPVNIANADIAPIGDQVKTGSAIEPEMDITFNGAPLVKDTDYEATFSDNVEVGTAGVVISGKGNFKGTAEAQFNIIETTESRLEAAEAAVAELQQQLADMETEKESIQQQLTQAQNSYDTLLEEKNGLETQVTNLTAEKTALEQREAELLQQKAELEENAQENQQALAEIQDELDEITAQKGQLETDLQNARNEKDAIEQQLTQAQTTVNDLTSQKEALETRNNELQTELDEAQAEIARLQKALEESKVDSLDEVKVSGIRNRVYTGSALQQTLTVTVGGKTLVNGTDYTVAYKDNKNVGTATVTISGKNEYRGTFSRTFKINPKGTSISKLIKGKKKMTVKWKKQAAQTTGYQIRYSLKKNFKSGVKTVTVKGPKTTSKVIKKLKAKKTYYVQVRTYKTVSGKKYYSKWSKTKYVKTK